MFPLTIKIKYASLVFAAIFFCRAGVALDITPRKYTCYKTSTPITMDAILNEPAWKNAVPINDWTICVDEKKTYQSATVKTTAWICWDDTYLYLAWECRDQDISGKTTKKDDAVWEDDAFEIHIDPDGDGKDYVEIEINPLNNCLDLLIPKPRMASWKEEAQFNVVGMRWVTRIYGTLNYKCDTDDKWVGEIRIPFASLSAVTTTRPVNLPPKNGDGWRIQCYRAERGGTVRGGVEWSAWSPTKAPHLLDEFAFITFLNQKP
ncbi:MAG: carbohydrate-binding family 9-like protein [Lentisphaeria bacterium]